MAHLGTGVQLAAVGPQNTYLDINPEVTAFRSVPVRSTQFASEAQEDLPLQSAGFGKTLVFEISPRGDMLADMHLQIEIPALQPLLGPGLPAVPMPTGYVFQPVSGVSALLRDGRTLSVALEGAAVTGGFSTRVRDGGAWTFSALDGSFSWEVRWYGSDMVVSAVVPVPGCAVPAGLRVAITAGEATASAPLIPGSSTWAMVTAGGVVAANDEWTSPLAYAMVRRLRFVVDEMVIHDQERLWYDLVDRLTVGAGHREGLAEMLGVGLSMGRAHTVVMPLKFLCCKGTQTPRAFFPTVLVPRCRVKLEVHLERFEGCLPDSLALPVVDPGALDIRLVGERVFLDKEERDAMMVRPLTVMYEGAQDMDAPNYAEASDGRRVGSEQALVDLSELNLPVKALAWVVYPEKVTTLFDYRDAVDSATLLLGSTERMVASGPMCSRQHVWTHAPRCLPGNVYLYSFALQAWGADPCGACDFSTVRKPVLRLSLKPETTQQQLKCKVWGMTYNWLTFEGGTVSRVFST